MVTGSARRTHLRHRRHDPIGGLADVVVRGLLENLLRTAGWLNIMANMDF
jgi:hypothetical protein